MYLTVNNATGWKESREQASWRVTQPTHVKAIVTVASYSWLTSWPKRTNCLSTAYREFLEDGTCTLGVGKHVGHFKHFEMNRFLYVKITDFRGSIWSFDGIWRGVDWSYDIETSRLTPFQVTQSQTYAVFKNTGNVLIDETWSRVRLTTVAVGKQ